jgi:hypothetical protein
MSTLSLCCVIWVKFQPFSNATQSQKWRQLRESGAIVPFGNLCLALLHHLPLPLPPSRLNPLCLNTEYRCLRDDPLVHFEPIRSPYTNAFVDHRGAIASSVRDCCKTGVRQLKVPRDGPRRSSCPQSLRSREMATSLTVWRI